MAQDLLGGALLLADLAAEPGLHLPPGVSLTQQGHAARQIGVGHTQVGVGGKGLFDQSIQHRIVIEPPPAIGKDMARSTALSSATNGRRPPGG
jgi:hypothetical protein